MPGRQIHGAAKAPQARKLKESGAIPIAAKVIFKNGSQPRQRMWKMAPASKPCQNASLLPA